MLPNEYRFNTRRTRNNDLSLKDSLLNAALGLGESGELQNIVKKQVFHGHDADASAVLDEAGDMLYYIDWILDLHGLTLSDAMNQNVAKLQARYPNGFSTERSINRKDK